MENASKALMIASIIIITVLLISIGIYLFNHSKEYVETSLDRLSTTEIVAINSKFEGYDGVLAGSRIKIFIGTLIANSKTYESDTFSKMDSSKGKYIIECEKLPAIQFKITVDGSAVDHTIQRPFQVANSAAAGDSFTVKQYVDELNTWRNKLENLTDYYSEYEFDTRGLLSKIIITDELPSKDS